MKAYFIGLLSMFVIAFLFIQPFYFGKLIGMNMDAQPAGAYIWSIIFEIVLCGLLYLPYVFGKKVLSQMGIK